LIDIKGFDQFGQLGRGSKSIVSMPKPQPLPKLLDKFIDRIFAGPYSSAAITRKDELFVWGDNYPSKLFLDTQSAIISSPNQTLLGKCPLQISLSQSHSACMDLTSRLLLTTAFSSTINNTLSGTVALQSSQSNPSWSEVSLLNDRPRQFFAGKGFTVLLTSKGKVVRLSKDEIVEVNLPGRVEKLLGHGDYSVAVQTEDGQWYAWGDNSCQTISPQTEERIAVPVRMQFDDEITVSSVVFSNSHAAALYNKKNSQVIQ
jgi:alpha-tubulin suppressor-like RCC1 family protein